MDIQRLVTQLTTDEDKRHKPYRDTVGKLTIGVGRNLDDRGLSDDEIAYLLANDIKIVEKELDREMPWWRGMSDARQNAIANIVFNIGMPRFKAFKKSIAALQDKNYELASIELMDSLWARQVGDRAARVTKLIRTGQF